MHKIVRNISIWLLGIYIAAILLSYDPSDPCFSVISEHNVKNLGGRMGAYLADILLQSVGIGSVLLIFFFFFAKKEQCWYFRFAIIIILLVSISSFLTILPVHNSWQWESYGGAIGIFLRGILVTYIGNIGFLFLSLCISLISFLYLFRFNFSHDIRFSFSIFGKKKVEMQSRDTKKTSAEPVIKSKFILPSLNFLNKRKERVKKGHDNLYKSNILKEILSEFGIEGEVIKISNGPVVTLYELRPAAGIKSSRIISLAGDIARSMSALSARIAVIPGRNAIGIELPNEQRETVLLRELFESEEYRDNNLNLPIALGHSISGKSVIVDLSKMPHLLVAGTTGSGKSVAINSMILSLLYRLDPKQCKFIMIDPKMLELSVYDSIPHLLAPVVTDPKKAVLALRWVVKEMENRYSLMSNLSVRNIEGYNRKISSILGKHKTIERKVQTGFDPESGVPIFERIKSDMQLMPFIVVVVDEMADLMLVAGKDIESSIQRLAQMARAAGIHIIMATQRPSVDVITGVIKANFPTRISFAVTSKIDSRTILGEQGAEQLLGMGDMLYMAAGGMVNRVHGAFVSDNEVQGIAEYLKSQGKPKYVQEVLDTQEEIVDLNDDDGDLYHQAVKIIRRDKKVSISYIQRQLRIGYNKAATIVEKMEARGIVSPPNSVGKREIIL